ncbi:RHS repeat-associated core domain-containing protein [Pseudomonas cannabina]|nr:MULTISPECIES: RHS repeat-associated core domain-containing protein [Pseudomonas syringae group]KPB73833.1 Uncharacterized protein AC507_1014 [Pseudomonas syringae pv. maculicola]MBM0140755.1 RHS repeat-associated core domain-containing protein [Pseudomonas cannabina pv. alisalensis]QHE99629.1 RHS repeat-associated core domain-containing protein [Pseudomonas syringae pv. maculicola str. ES4326]QQN21670.1 RHS repeat-associated core domain-containing protein [Pseudomonas cannabina pv. alisalens
MPILCKYSYDPLDRVSSLTPLAQAVARRFYNGERLMTELQGGTQRTFFQAGGHLLAQQHLGSDGVATTLIAGDRHNSVLHASDAAQQADIAYSPYGYHDAAQPIAGLPGFNGEKPDPVTGHYLLGNGYRAYNPVLRRFNSPDSLSPFGEGGLNAYAYCVGDPVNRVDPTGHMDEELWASIGLAVVGALAAGIGIKFTSSLKSLVPFSTSVVSAGGTTVSLTISEVVKASHAETSSVLRHVGLGAGVLSAVFGVGILGQGIAKKRGLSLSRLFRPRSRSSGSNWSELFPGASRVAAPRTSSVGSNGLVNRPAFNDLRFIEPPPTYAQAMRELNSLNPPRSNLSGTNSIVLPELRTDNSGTARRIRSTSV